MVCQELPDSIGSRDRISFDSLMLAQDKFTCKIFDLRFNQLTLKKQGTPKGIPCFIGSGDGIWSRCEQYSRYRLTLGLHPGKTGS